MSTFPKSDHCDGERFFNRYKSADRSFGEVLKWMRTRRATPWPKQVALAKHSTPPSQVESAQAGITFVGHSTFLIRTASAVLITDPVFTSHAGPLGRLGPRRVRPPAIAPDALPPVDIVLVSHNHYDHFQPSSLRLFAGRASFAAPLGLGRSLPPEGGSQGSLVELDWWQSTRVGAATITSVPAQHFSARTPWDRDRTLWCGFVVQADGVTVYFAGDTGYSPHFAEVAERFPSIDVALLPIGAYEPRWFMTPAHMNPEEAVRAHRELRPRLSIGMHFGTFQLTDEGIDDPLRALEQARAAAGVDAHAFRVLDFGESFVTGDHKGRGIQETS